MLQRTVIKKSMVPTENRHINQWNAIGNSHRTPYKYSYLIFDKDAKICIRDKIASSTNVSGKPGFYHTEK